MGRGPKFLSSKSIYFYSQGGGGGLNFFLCSSFYWAVISFHRKIGASPLPGSTRFWWGCHCHCDCDQGKTKSTPSLLDLN